MSILKRYFKEGNVYFITVVTYNHNPILSGFEQLLQDTIKKMKNKYNAAVDFYVILPDHFHLIISPPNNDLSDFVHDVKLSFGANYRKKNEMRSGRIWLGRYWDHVIRNQNDMNNHIDYIHFNPVKHWGGKKEYLKLKIRDERKKEICISKGISLIFINYDDPLEKNFVSKLIDKTKL